MRFNPRVVSSAAAIALTCAVSAAAYFYKSRTVQLNEVMVFCKLQFNAYNCFDKLMSYVEAAKTSVSVCMPGIQNPAIQGRLIQLLNKKIDVRIIIDRSGYNESNNFLIEELIDAGAEIKYNASEPGYRMQHKFCLIDDKVLMTGTLNWGNDLSSDHWNYVYITNKKQLVEPVKREFYHMWKEFQTQTGVILPRMNSDVDDDSNTDSEAVCDHDQASEVPEPLTFRETLTTPEVLIM